ncbi:Arm DNA-binding domain-containing protein [Ruegeria sp.]|uniref:Arm DNA-binding domain-containing protein n=1 Tax=Ruegeria sp. TaxID=1879320 RepID=UPI003B5AE37B
MKPRNNPTNEQRLRREQRGPIDSKDPRVKNDAYWALRHQGFSDAYAKRAFRDLAPGFYTTRIQADTSDDDYLRDVDPDDILVEPLSVPTECVKLSVLVRPDLNEEVVTTAAPRDIEYTIWSDRPSGFGLRVRSSGVRSYIVMFRIKGRSSQGKITLGKPEEIPLETARWLAREVRIIAACGCDPRPLHKNGELLKQYRRELRLGPVPPRYPGVQEMLDREDESY